MKFFNADLHVSVIEDVATQFKALGHDTDIHMMSGHSWVTGRPKASAGVGAGPGGKIGYGSLNLDTWESFFDDGPLFGKAGAWALENAAALSGYDGYVVTYPPSFALLYKNLPGHTIMHVPIRYDGPHFTNDPRAWRVFNARLNEMYDRGKLTVIANSLYDALYFEYFTGLSSRYISSTCDYIDKLTAKWSPRGGKTLLAFGEHSGCREAAQKLANVVFVRDVLPGRYTHEEIIRSPGIVWIPYNCSIMSFFEHYWLNIPMFVPTKEFLHQLWLDKLALSQLSWHKSMTSYSNVPRSSAAKLGRFADPHTLEGVQQWMELYDFYNANEFPHLIYFNSWADLAFKIVETELGPVSKAMEQQNVVRRERNLKAWAEALTNVKR